ncbi:MAG: class I SAM-dependent methyltransferase [Caldilineaceae bacterium]|nr:class I SAM-dependent methyltransferase [Caldilineaceae bacterium]
MMMDAHVRHTLLELNRQFYTTVAPDFDQTRQGWTPGLTRLLEYVPRPPAGQQLTVLDVGCGNGRFARMVDSLGRPFLYVGVDGSEKLLALAQQNTADLQHGAAYFCRGDLAELGWMQALDALPARDAFANGFDFVLCTATLQHLPGYDLRRRLVQELSALTNGVLALSAWQFLSSARFRTRQIPWSHIGLAAADVEPGDALLPWKQGQFAVRYVHQLDADELKQLATESRLHVADQFRADGKEGNLNLYMILACG